MRDGSGNVSSCVVTLGYTPDSENCECTADNLTLNGSVAPADYKARLTITSAGTVGTGDTVLYKAVQSITLSPGFTAEAGSFFRARTDDCSTGSSSVDLRSSTPAKAAPNALESKVYPNPFHDAFTLDLELPEDAPVSIGLHSLDGQMVRQLLRNEVMSAGLHRLTIDASHLPDGMYVLHIESGNQTLTQKVVRISQ